MQTIPRDASVTLIVDNLVFVDTSIRQQGLTLNPAYPNVSIRRISGTNDILIFAPSGSSINGSPWIQVAGSVDIVLDDGKFYSGEITSGGLTQAQVLTRVLGA